MDNIKKTDRMYISGAGLYLLSGKCDHGLTVSLDTKNRVFYRYGIFSPNGNYLLSTKKI